MGSTIGSKNRKDHFNIFKLGIVIISAEKKNLIILMMTKIIKRLRFLNLINIMVNKRNLSFNSSNLLYGFGTTILLLKKGNKLSILPI